MNTLPIKGPHRTFLQALARSVFSNGRHTDNGLFADLVSNTAALGSPAPSQSARSAADDQFTQSITCRPLVDTESLDDRQRADLVIGTAAVEAAWKAVQADPLWANHSLMRSCILLALIVRDILHGIGRSDAVVMPVGAQLLRYSNRELLNALTIGSPDAPVLPNAWNAHMVVKIGDILFDPTCGQTQRHWNAAPDTAALLFRPGCGKVSLFEHGEADAIAQFLYNRSGYDYVMTYFHLTPASAKRAVGWEAYKDALPKRRAPLVQSALQRLRNIQLPTARMGVAA